MGLGGLLQMLGGDLEVRRQGCEIAVDEARYVQQHAPVHEQFRRIMGDVEVDADTAAANAARISRGRGGVDAAEQLAISANVPDRVDAGGAMLAAPMLD